MIRFKFKKYFFHLILIIVSFGAILGFFVLNDYIKSPFQNNLGIKWDEARDLTFHEFFSTSHVTTIEGLQAKIQQNNSPITIVSFWFYFCLPCLEEMKMFTQLKMKYGEKISIFPLTTYQTEDEQEMKEEMKEIFRIKRKFAKNLDLYFDQNRALFNKLIEPSVPYSIVFINGKYYEEHLGLYNFLSGEFISLVEETLKGSSASSK